MDQQDIQSLLDKYLQGNCTPEEAEKIHTWLGRLNREDEEWSGKSADDQKVYLTGLYKDIRQTIRKQNKKREQDENKRGKLFRLTFARIAAALILLCGLSLLFYMSPSGEASRKYTLERTLAGELKELRLDDGSLIWLNQGSSLRYPREFTAGSREVYLEGEAFFEIARDTSRPFIIHTAEMQTRVLGTSFNVQAYKGEKEMRVVVVTGKVEVSVPLETKGEEKEKILLQASEMATYAASEKQLSRKEVPDPEQYTAWKSGKLLFNRTPMSEVALTLERAFGLKIKMENSAIERCEITGRFDKGQEAGLTIEAICKSIEASYRIEDGTVFIQGQGCEN